MGAGIEKYIKTPEILWDIFLQYREQVKENPRKRYHLNIKTGEMVPEPLEVPLTKEGFYNYCGHVAEITTLKDYFSNRDERYKEFVPICTRIVEEIRQDQIEGGMVGQYNASITARINGLVEKVDSNLSGELKVTPITGMIIQ